VDYWTSRLIADGGDLDAIIDAFANSMEANERFGGLPDEALVDEIYLRLFGRAPDAAGRAFYLQALRDGTTTPGRVALDVLKGATGDDALIVASKILLANHFTDQVVAYERLYTDDQFAGARAVLDLVTADPASLEDAEDAADALVREMPEA